MVYRRTAKPRARTMDSLMARSALLLLWSMLFGAALSACGENDPDFLGDGPGPRGDRPISVKLDAPAECGCAGIESQPRFVILFIADGMGFEQVRAARMYENGDTAPLSFETLPVKGQIMTASASDPVTDSAAAATAMATGHKVDNGVISVAVPGDGAALPTALEIWHGAGGLTGLVTTATGMTDATPAAFASHRPNRFDSAGIATDYWSQTRPNVLFGFGAEGFDETTAQAAGYTLVIAHETSLTATPAVSSHFAGVFSSQSAPPLAHLTAAAIDALSSGPCGFFLLVEHEGTDTAGHANDLHDMILSLLEFRDAVDVALDWAADRTDVLVLVASDHETGGLQLAGKSSPAGMLPTHQYTTGLHTEANVPLYGNGAHAEPLSGTIDNTEIFPVLARITDSSARYDSSSCVSRADEADHF